MKPSTELSRKACLKWHSVVLGATTAWAALGGFLLAITAGRLLVRILFVLLFGVFSVAQIEEFALRVLFLLAGTVWLTFACLSTLGVAAWARSIRSLIVVEFAALLATPIFLWGLWNALLLIDRTRPELQP